MNEFWRYSPDQKHKIALTYDGSDPKGDNNWYTIALDGKDIANVIIGGMTTWSDDSRFLALQEWLTTDYNTGPRTRVKLIDVRALSYANGPAIEQAFVENFVFHDNQLSYEIVKRGICETQHLSMNVAKQHWATLDFKKPEPDMIWDPVIDERRLAALHAALPLLEASSCLLAGAGKDIKGAEEFRQDVRTHFNQNKGGITPDKPITFGRLGCLYAYPWRLRQNGFDETLAADLDTLIKFLDITGPDSKPRMKKVTAFPSILNGPV